MNKRYALYTNIIVICFVLGIVLIFNFITKNSQIKSNDYLEGQIVSVSDDYILMDVNGSDYQVYVNTDTLNVGDVIKVTYDGNVLETSPMQLIASKVDIIQKKEETSNADIVIPDNDSNIDDNVDDSNADSNKENVVISSENDVIAYFNNLNNEVVNETSFSSKLKNGFITVVDFFFYDGEIKGYKFSELTDKAKIEVMKIAFMIDSKIESKFPTYKEYLSSKYHNFKDEMVSLYMETGSIICDSNIELCTTVKSTFSDIKSFAKIGWSYVKDLIGNGLEKIDDWYLIYSGKN